MFNSQFETMSIVYFKPPIKNQRYPSLSEVSTEDDLTEGAYVYNECGTQRPLQTGLSEIMCSIINTRKVVRNMFVDEFIEVCDGYETLSYRNYRINDRPDFFDRVFNVIVKAMNFALYKANKETMKYLGVNLRNAYSNFIDFEVSESETTTALRVNHLPILLFTLKLDVAVFFMVEDIFSFVLVEDETTASGFRFTSRLKPSRGNNSPFIPYENISYIIDSAYTTYLEEYGTIDPSVNFDQVYTENREKLSDLFKNHKPTRELARKQGPKMDNPSRRNIKNVLPTETNLLQERSKSSSTESGFVEKPNETVTTKPTQRKVKRLTKKNNRQTTPEQPKEEKLSTEIEQPKDLKKPEEKPTLINQPKEAGTDDDDWSSHAGTEKMEDDYMNEKLLFSDDEEKPEPPKDTKLRAKPEVKVDEAVKAETETKPMSWSKVVSTQPKPTDAKPPTPAKTPKQPEDTKTTTIEKPTKEDITALFKQFTDLVGQIEPGHKWLCFIVPTKENPTPNNITLAESIRAHMAQICRIGRRVDIETLLSTANPKPHEIPTNALEIIFNLAFARGIVVINDAMSDPSLVNFLSRSSGFFSGVKNSPEWKRIADIAIAANELLTKLMAYYYAINGDDARFKELYRMGCFAQLASVVSTYSSVLARSPNYAPKDTSDLEKSTMAKLISLITMNSYNISSSIDAILAISKSIINSCARISLNKDSDYIICAALMLSSKSKVIEIFGQQRAVPEIAKTGGRQSKGAMKIVPMVVDDRVPKMPETRSSRTTRRSPRTAQPPKQPPIQPLNQPSKPSPTSNNRFSDLYVETPDMPEQEEPIETKPKPIEKPSKSVMKKRRTIRAPKIDIDQLAKDLCKPIEEDLYVPAQVVNFDDMLKAM